MSENHVVRAKRVDLSFPLSFLEDGVAIQGHCINISESGLMATFERDLELWTTGSLQLSFSGTVLLLRARVARCSEKQAGLSFLFADEEQRESVRATVAFVATQSKLAGGPAPF